MAAGYRQFVDSGNTAGPPNYPAGVTIHPKMATLVGSCLAVQFCLSNDNGDVTLTCSDSQGNSYTKRLDIADTTTAGDERYVWFICDSATHALSTSDTITVTGAGTDYLELLFWEVTGTTGYLSGSGLYQAPITGSTANNLNSGNLAGGSGQVFVLSCSMNSLDAGTTPYYPTVGTGLTAGGQWFQFDQLGNAYVASWGYGTFTAPGTFTAKWTSSTGSTSDHYVTTAIAFGVAASTGTTLSAAAVTYSLALKTATLSTSTIGGWSFDSNVVTFDSNVYTMDGGMSNAFNVSASTTKYNLTLGAASLTSPMSMSLAAAAVVYSLTLESATFSTGQSLSSNVLVAGAVIFNLSIAPSSSDFQTDAAMVPYSLTFESATLLSAATLTARTSNYYLEIQSASLLVAGSRLLVANSVAYSLSIEAALLIAIQPIKVCAVTAGIYRGQPYEPGDVFYIFSSNDFSDATQNAQLMGAEYAPGWMTLAAPGTPLYQSESQAQSPTFPAVDPARRFVL